MTKRYTKAYICRILENRYGLHAYVCFIFAVHDMYCVFERHYACCSHAIYSRTFFKVSLFYRLHIMTVNITVQKCNIFSLDTQFFSLGTQFFSLSYGGPEVRPPSLPHAHPSIFSQHPILSSRHPIFALGTNILSLTTQYIYILLAHFRFTLL